MEGKTARTTEGMIEMVAKTKRDEREQSNADFAAATAARGAHALRAAGHRPATSVAR